MTNDKPSHDSFDDNPGVNPGGNAVGGDSVGGRVPDSYSSLFFEPEHHELRELVRTFAEEVVRPRVPVMEDAASADTEVPRLIAWRGWIGATIPARYGGMDVGHRGKTVILEELSRESGAMGMTAQASQLGTSMILHYGTEDQKQRWLPAIAHGDCLPTIAVTEHASGSDVLGISSTARRMGDTYVVNGRKAWVGNSHIGDVHGVVARTDQGRGGLTAFLVEADTPGLTVAPYTPAMGLRGFGFGELVFDDCVVPADNRLGREGDGFAVALSSSVLYGKDNMAAVALGIHQTLVDATVNFVRGRPRRGTSLAHNDAVLQRIGDLRSGLSSARLALYHAATLLDRGHPADTELYNAKLITVSNATDAANTAMQLHGAHGFHRLPQGNPVERCYRDIPLLYAPAGTAEIQRRRLAEILLGTAHEPWSTTHSHRPRRP